MKRRDRVRGDGATRIVAGVLAALVLAWNDPAPAADPNKVLRLATFDIETLDPQQIHDDPSSQVAAAIFEGLYDWEYLGSPSKLAPVTATALPEIADGGRTRTSHGKPGNFFAHRPAFKGQRSVP